MSAAAGAPTWRPSPRGLAELVGQVLVLLAVDVVYEVVRAHAEGSRGVALGHAHQLVRAERALGIFHERGIQVWTAQAPGFVHDIARVTYQNCQRLFVWSFVLFVFVRRHGAYRPLRNTLITLDAIGLVGYWLYPTAPPRLTPGYGFVDTLDPSGTHLRSSLVGSLTNLYAAVPSLHTAYALAVGITGYRVARTLAGRLAACVYPLLVVFATVATGNHWFLDAVAGAGALALAWLIVALLHCVRPLPGRARRRPRRGRGARSRCGERA